MEVLLVPALLFVILLAVEEGTAQVCAPITDQAYSKEENKVAKLVCEFQTAPTTSVKWLDPNGKTISTGCQGASSRFTVECTPTLNPTRYTLVFNASWSDRGSFTCQCESNNIKSLVKFTVKVPPKEIDATCTVADTGKPCNETSRKGSDILEFSAKVGCASPSPTITWTDDLGAPIAISNLGGSIKNDLCSGDEDGQTSMVSIFKATWDKLGKPNKVNVAAANEVGGTYKDIPIHKPPEKADTTAIVVGSVIGVVLFLVIIGLVVFLVMRHKKKKANEYA